MGDFSSGKKALVLGAGYVSAPVIEYLTRDPDLGVTVAAAIKVPRDETGLVCLPTQLERSLQLYWWW